MAVALPVDETFVNKGLSMLGQSIERVPYYRH
jgi:hypothetical protein